MHLQLPGQGNGSIPSGIPMGVTVEIKGEKRRRADTRSFGPAGPTDTKRRKLNTPHTSVASSSNHGVPRGDVIEFHIGPERKPYKVHAELLHCSAFKEHIRQRRVIHLAKMSPKVFELFYIWLYRHKLPSISIDNDETAKQQATKYIKLYVNAVIWLLPDLQNAIMDLLRARPTCSHGWFPEAMIKHVYNNTERDSPLRAYVVDSFIFKSYHWTSDTGGEEEDGRKGMLNRQLEYGNKDFVVDYCEALRDIAAKSKVLDPNRKTEGLYHVREKVKKCAK